jgi:hypothetical protein
VQQSDVASGVTVQLIVGGQDATGEATLDLCNGSFPSESLRTARLQVVAADGQGNSLLSTEAVLYTGSAATAQAFAELRATPSKCPGSPVASPVGEATVTTRFNAPPDATWPAVPGVDRVAFDFRTTDASNNSQRAVAVYLRRGKLLMGVYFPQPDGAQSAVGGQTTIPGIVGIFESRIAQLPESAVS